MIAFLLVALLASSALADIPPPPTPVPGVSSRCDRPTSCVPYQARYHYSFDWLCCEDFVWPASHTTSVLAVYLFVPSIIAALFASLAWELFEIFLLSVFGGFLFFRTNEMQLETLGGSLLGDVLSAGAIGLLISVMLSYVTNFGGFFRNFYDMSNWMRFKYGMLAVAVGLPLIFSGVLTPTDQSIAGGLLLQIGIYAVVLLVIVPLSTATAQDKKLVWRTAEAWNKRWYLFGGWFLIIAVLNVQVANLYSYLANNYYQIWVADAAIIFILLIFVIVRATRSDVVKARRRATSKT